LIHETVPAELPGQIAFFNLDLGPGRSAELLEDDLYHALASVYDRMTPGAIAVLQDYCDPRAYERPGYHFPSLIFHRDYWNLYPQVKRACDRFFHDKPEKVFPLYAGNYSHGYFRKKIERAPKQESSL
jgi:O-methyltransferase